MKIEVPEELNKHRFDDDDVADDPVPLMRCRDKPSPCIFRVYSCPCRRLISTAEIRSKTTTRQRTGTDGGEGGGCGACPCALSAPLHLVSNLAARED